MGDDTEQVCIPAWGHTHSQGHSGSSLPCPGSWQPFLLSLYGASAGCPAMSMTGVGPAIFGGCEWAVHQQTQSCIMWSRDSCPKTRPVARSWGRGWSRGHWESLLGRAGKHSWKWRRCFRVSGSTGASLLPGFWNLSASHVGDLWRERLGASASLRDLWEQPLYCSAFSGV